jgi:hypothetical protein
MDPAQARRTILEGEFLVLQAMCQGGRDGRVWTEGMRLLEAYRFRDPLHQLVFDTLRELNTDEPAVIRQLLPQRLTAKGFPDVDLDPFFFPSALTTEAALSMMELVRYTERLDDRPDLPASQ